MMIDQIDESTPADFVAWVRSRATQVDDAAPPENPASQPVTRREGGPSEG
jgi:hypothetical protein